MLSGKEIIFQSHSAGFLLIQFKKEWLMMTLDHVEIFRISHSLTTQGVHYTSVFCLGKFLSVGNTIKLRCAMSK